jgi:hypothetical protein
MTGHVTNTSSVVFGDPRYPAALTLHKVHIKYNANKSSRSRFIASILMTITRDDHHQVGFSHQERSRHHACADHG